MKPLNINFTGDPQVIQNILKKKKLLAKNDPAHEEIKTVLILPGGGQRGVIEEGVAVALEKYELIDAFDYVIGVSTGAPVGYYMLGKEAAIGTTIYFDENVKNHFVNLLRLWKVIDIDTLGNIFRSRGNLDDIVRKSRPKFLVGVTDKDTGKEEFVDVKKSSDPLSCVIASICVPILDGGKSVLINGRFYVDGALSNPLPITYAIEELNATDILIPFPRSLVMRNQEPKILLWVLDNFFRRMISDGLRSQLHTYIDRFNHELEYIIGNRNLPKGVRVGVIHPTQMPISDITMNKRLLEAGVLSSMEFTEKLFIDGQPVVKKIK